MTVTLRGAAAAKLRKFMAEAKHDKAEDAIEELLETVEEPLDPEMEEWLRTEIVRRAEANEADPSRSMTADEVRAALARK